MANFPVKFPDNREIFSGDRFARDCAHHHPVFPNRGNRRRSEIGRFCGDLDAYFQRSRSLPTFNCLLGGFLAFSLRSQKFRSPRPSEMVILTCRTLHFSRAQSCATVVSRPETTSSSHRRPRAMALTRRARRSNCSGRTSPRDALCGSRIWRDFLDGGFCSPWQNGYAERLIGSIRRECLDHVVVFGERHLRHLLLSYMKYYNEARTHLSLEKDAPVSRAVERAGQILCRPILGGLHHQYVRI